jgi:hypothetical protein
MSTVAINGQGMAKALHRFLCCEKQAPILVPWLDPEIAHWICSTRHGRIFGIATILAVPQKVNSARPGLATSSAR